MKIKITLITLVLIQCIHAQTITSGSLTPVIGESFTMNSIDVSSASPPLIEVCFDYSTSTLDPFNINHNIVNPTSTPYTSDFLTSNYCVEAFGSDYFYYTANATQIVQNGYYIFGTLLTYSDSRKIMQYPLTPGASFVDSYLGYMDDGSICYKRTGMISVDWHDNGTLITSQGSFNNIVQIKSFDQFDDVEIDCFTQTEIGSPNNTQNTIYEYFEMGRHYPLIRIDIIGPLGSEYLVGKQLLVTNLNLAQEKENPCAIYYNQQSIQINTLSNHQIKYGKLVDMTGKNVVEFSQIPSTFIIDLSSISSGLYLLELYDENHQQHSFKIIK